jgi:hypothetical protein
MQSDDAFERWMGDLEARHLAELRFPEVARALRALSSAYVERRGRLPRGAALDGAGKRAAFALFYGPLHFLIVRHIAESLLVPGLAEARGISAERRRIGPTYVIDLGCGTGAAGAACAAVCDPVDLVVGIDTHPWTLKETAATYREFGLKGRTEKGDLASTRRLDAPRTGSRGGRSLFVAAFALNELSLASLDAAMQRLCVRADAGDAVLIVEPLAGFVAPWWRRWQREIERSGGRSDEWRFRTELPAIVAKLDHAAGLDHRELTARSLWIASLTINN